MQKEEKFKEATANRQKLTISTSSKDRKFSTMSSPYLPRELSRSLFHQPRPTNFSTTRPNYKHLIKSKKFAECEYRFSDPMNEAPDKQVFKFQLCGANGMRKANYVGY